MAAEGTGRHAAIIGDLEIPVPFDLGLFVAWLQRRRGRGIRLCPFRSGAGMPCGFWIGTAEAGCWLAGSLALSTPDARASYLRQAPEHESIGVPETD